MYGIKMSITKVSSKGQITIPKEIRDELDLKPGTRVILEAVGGQAILKPLETPSKSMKGIGRKTKKQLGNLTAVELVRKMRLEDGEEL